MFVFCEELEGSRGCRGGFQRVKKEEKEGGTVMADLLVCGRGIDESFMVRQCFSNDAAF